MYQYYAVQLRFGFTILTFDSKSKLLSSLKALTISSEVDFQLLRKLAKLVGTEEEYNCILTLEQL